MGVFKYLFANLKNKYYWFTRYLSTRLITTVKCLPSALIKKKRIKSASKNKHIQLTCLLVYLSTCLPVNSFTKTKKHLAKN